MTFKEYLVTRQVNNNIQGDFVNDAKSDSKFPDVTTWPELNRYLLQRNAYFVAIEAARLVWSAYQAKLRRDQKRRSPLLV
jgi:uncharacterized protein YozE (UPF0346 family)